MNRDIVNVEAAIVRDGRYLMIVWGEEESHAPGTLSIPGGKVEDAGLIGNVLEETLRREIGLIYIESKPFITDDGGRGALAPGNSTVEAPEH